MNLRYVISTVSHPEAYQKLNVSVEDVHHEGIHPLTPPSSFIINSISSRGEQVLSVIRELADCLSELLVLNSQL